MSEETPPESHDTPETPKPKKKAARKRAKPVEKPAEPTAEKPAAEPAPATEAAPTAAAGEATPAPVKAVRISERHVPVKPSAEARSEAKSDDSGDSSEPVAVISEPPGSEGGSGGGKRRRRRRRKSGQGEDGGEAEAAPRPRLDPDAVARRAWKIYLAEVSEEGLALISDQDAKELTRRSFRLAEIFLEEASRRQGSPD